MAASGVGKVLKVTIHVDTKNSIRNLNRLYVGLDRVYNKLNQINSTNVGLSRQIRTATIATNNLSNAANRASQNFKKNNDAVSSLVQKLRQAYVLYMGFQALKNVFETSDRLTGSRNKLDYYFASQNGGDYAAAGQMSNEAMDKMFAASQGARTDYMDMMDNVSKSMVLSGGAFKDNIDNAIRFQEIMAKAYSISGASAAEQSTSMYQMIQALGAGTLQGDELRSVREGAQLAYQAIEQFAQGVYNTTDSLKDMASQGKITSDIVVAGIMNAGDKIDEAFSHTAMTFDQAAVLIKNSAVNNFRAINEQLTAALNSEAGMNFLKGINTAITLAIKALGGFIQWFANNWGWLKYIVISIIAVMIAYLIKLAAQAVITGIIMLGSLLMGASPIYLIIIALGVLAAVFYACGMTIEQIAATVAAAIITYLGIVLMMSIITGTVMISIPMLILLVVIAVVAIIIAVLAATSEDIIDAIGNIVGVVYGAGAVIQTVAENIGIFFQNGFRTAQAAAGTFVANAARKILALANLINRVLSIFNIQIDTSGLEGAISSAESYATQAKASKQSYGNIGQSWQKGFDIGHNIGANWATEVGNKVKGALNSASGFIANGTVGGGLNLDDYGDLGDAIGDTAGNTGKTAGNTGKMASIAEEDLTYLRRIAEREWKKEFTTAAITVNMTNNNTVNGDSDLDGIVTKLTDMLYEELNTVAAGVHV